MPYFDGMDQVVLEAPLDGYTSTAANELVAYLMRMSGRPWRVVQGLSLDRAVRLKLDPAVATPGSAGTETVRTEISPAGITITGASPVAVRHGAYLLLESLGVRWYFSNPAWEVVPAALRDPVLGITVRTPRYFERRLSNPIGYLVADAANGQLKWEAWERHNCLPSDKLYEIRHSWSDFFNRQALAAADPTSVCYVPTSTLPRQVIASHPLVVQTALAYARTRIALPTPAGPLGEALTRMAVPISPEDGATIFECEYYAPGSITNVQLITDEVFRLANTVAEQLAAEFPGKMAAVLSYSWYSRLPNFPLSPNLIVQCTDFVRSPTPGQEALAARVQAFKATGAQVGTYLYLDVWPWWRDRIDPPGKFAGHVAQVRESRDLDVGHFAGEISDGWGAKGRLYWLAARSAWEPAFDPDALLDDFYTHAFGLAKLPMERYWRRLDDSGPTAIAYPLAFKALHEALGLAGDAAVRARIRHVILYTYFWWRWSNTVEGIGDGLAGVNRAAIEALYVFAQRVRREAIIVARQHWDACAAYLQARYGAAAPVGFPDQPYTDAEVDGMLAEAVLATNALAAQEVTQLAIRDLQPGQLTSLGRTDLPLSAPDLGRLWDARFAAGRLPADILVLAPGPGLLSATLGGSAPVAAPAEWLAPDGTVLAVAPPLTQVAFVIAPITFSVTVPAAGLYILRTYRYEVQVLNVNAPAALDVTLPHIWWMLPALREYYCVVEPGQPVLSVAASAHIGSDARPLVLQLTSPSGLITAAALVPDAGGQVQVLAPEPGVWKVGASGNSDRLTFTFSGMVPLLWHDPVNMLTLAGTNAAVLSFVPGSLVAPASVMAGETFQAVTQVQNTGGALGTVSLRAVFAGFVYTSAPQTVLAGQTGPLALAVIAGTVTASELLTVELLDGAGAVLGSLSAVVETIAFSPPIILPPPPPPPDISIAFVTVPPSVEVGASLAVSLMLTNLGGQDGQAVPQVDISGIPGTAQSGPTLTVPAGGQVSHSFTLSIPADAAPGVNTIAFMASDPITGVTLDYVSGTISITAPAPPPPPPVTPLPPTAAFSVNPDNGVAGVTTFFFTDQSTGLVETWSWEFGDGFTSADPAPLHIYEAAGSYMPRLTVSGPGGSAAAQYAAPGLYVVAAPTQPPVVPIPTYTPAVAPQGGGADFHVIVINETTSVLEVTVRAGVEVSLSGVGAALGVSIGQTVVGEVQVTLQPGEQREVVVPIRLDPSTTPGAYTVVISVVETATGAVLGESVFPNALAVTQPSQAGTLGILAGIGAAVIGVMLIRRTPKRRG